MNENSTSTHSGSKAISSKTNGKWQSPIDYDAFMERAERIFTRVNRRAQSVAKEYPVQVAAGALAVGFLLGATLLRRRA